MDASGFGWIMLIFYVGAFVMLGLGLAGSRAQHKAWCKEQEEWRARWRREQEEQRSRMLVELNAQTAQLRKEQ